jgi:hypothetical protein
MRVRNVYLPPRRRARDWTGVVAMMGAQGNSTGLVGTPEQVADSGTTSGARIKWPFITQKARPMLARPHQEPVIELESP